MPSVTVRLRFVLARPVIRHIYGVLLALGPEGQELQLLPLAP